jgi:hypothetical protein
MGKKKKSRLLIVAAVTLILAVVLALIIFLGSTSSQAIVPGVKVGDEFIYDIKTAWSSNDSNATLDNYYVELNMTEWYKIAVTDVNGSKVTINTIWRFTNATEVDATSTLRVDTGIAYPTNAFWGIYAANLNVNERIRPLGVTHAIVNETIPRDYTSGTREINVIQLDEQYYDADDPFGNTTWTDFMNVKFDKQTGMLVEFHNISMFTNPSQTYTLSWILLETNVWDV